MTAPVGDVEQDALKSATLAGVRWVSLARVAGEVLAFASMIALARLIAPKEFGEFAITVVAIEIALTISGEGIGTALVQRRDVRHEHLEAAMFMSICLGLALAAVGFFVAPFIFTPLFGSRTTTLVQLSTPLFLIAAVTAVPLAVAQRRLAFRLISLVQILAVVVRAVVSVALALAGLNAAALVLGWVAASAAMLLALLVYARVPWPRPRLAAAREIAGFGFLTALSGLSWTGFRNADFAIVGARLGTVDAGLYWRAYQLAIEYQRKIGATVHQIAFPIYSRTPDFQAMFALRRRVVRLVAATLLPALAALAVLAPWFVPWLLGSAWKTAVVPTQILSAAGMLTVLSDTMGAVVLAAGRARGWLAYHVGCFAAYAATVYVAAGYGLTAVCAAVVAVQAAGTLAAYRGLLHGLVERPLRCLWDDVAPGMAAAAALVAVTLGLIWALSASDAPTALVILVAAAAGGLAALATLRWLSRPTWNDLGRVAGRIVPGGRRRDAAPVPIAAAKSA